MKQTKDAYKRLSSIIKAMTYREAAATLNKEGYKTATGKKWNANIIASWVFNNRAKEGRKINNPPAETKKPEAKTLRTWNLSKAQAKKIGHQMSATKKLGLIKEIVMGLHQ